MGTPEETGIQRYQVAFCLWQIKLALKHSHLPKYYDQC